MINPIFFFFLPFLIIILSYSTLIILRLKFVELKFDPVNESKLSEDTNLIIHLFLNTDEVSSEIYKETWREIQCSRVLH